jgi:stearoyl-CoA desaturase (delta-9 desaturase)
MSDGLIQLPWWGYALTALVLAQITIACVTLYLHRSQAHMAVRLHPAVSHFFRFWLWLTTGMVTREWVAVHRKHHARVETEEDPHSPRIYGIHKVLWLGAWLYRREAGRSDTLEKYGAGTPDDWIERRLYTPHNGLGVLFMLGIDLVLFGPLAGSLIWLVQMAWIPFWAAGVINGIGHYWGYRNFEVGDASKNIVPWGFFIGGEELHNNHHAYAGSAKFSNKRWEFDIGWVYLRVLGALGLAEVKKTAPKLVVNESRTQFDLETVRALINSRFQVMANFAGEVLNNVHAEELRKLGADRDARALLKRARRLMRRESSLLSSKARAQLGSALKLSPRLDTVYAMKQRLQAVWTRANASQESLLLALEEWCRSAESSGIEALREFSAKLRRYELAPSAV